MVLSLHELEDEEQRLSKAEVTDEEDALVVELAEGPKSEVAEIRGDVHA